MPELDPSPVHIEPAQAPIPPIIIALDTGSFDAAQRLIDQTYQFPNDLVGYKVPSGILARHYNELIPSLRNFGKFVVADTRFVDYTNKTDDEVTTFLQTDRPPSKTLPPHDLPNAFTLLAIQEGSAADRAKMKNVVLPKAHQLGVRVFGIMPPIAIADNDHDQLANQAQGRYIDGLALGIDAIDIPQPALDGLRNYGIIQPSLKIIVSRLARKGRSSSETVAYVRKLRREADIASVYMGRPLQQLQSENRKPADFISACLG